MSLTPDMSPDMVYVSPANVSPQGRGQRKTLFKDPTVLFSAHAAHAESLSETRDDLALASIKGMDSAAATSSPGRMVMPLYNGAALDMQQTWRIPVCPSPQVMQQDLYTLSGSLDLLRTLLRSSGIYALAASLSPLSSLVLIPFLVHSLSGTAYGALVVLNAMMVFAAAVMQLGLGAAFTHVANADYQADAGAKRAALSTMTCMLAVVSLVAVSLMWLFASPIATVVLLDPAYAEQVKLAALLIGLQNMTVPGLTWLRVVRRPLSFGILTASGVLLNLVVSFWLVHFDHLGIDGALLGTGSGSLIVIVGSAPMVFRQGARRFDRVMALDLLAFGVSTLPGLLSIWVLQLADRYFLLSYSTLLQTASYSVAYMFGNISGPLVVAPFSLAWYALLHSFARKPQARQLFRLLFRWYSACLLFTACASAVLAGIVLRTWFSPIYAAQETVIPLIALANVCYGLFDLFVVGLYIRNKVWYTVLYMPAAALLHLLGNFVLIPLYGPMGAAWSTLLAYAALALLAYLVNQRIYPLHFDLDRFGLAVLLGVGCYGLSFWLLHSGISGTLPGWCAVCIVLVGYFVSLLVLCEVPVRKLRRMFASRTLKVIGGR